MPENYRIEEVRTHAFCMDVIIFGNGKRPLVILPGLSLFPMRSSARAIAETYCPTFGKDYTVYLIDRRKDPPKDYEIREMASDTACVMQKLNLAEADVFGASQGGMIASYLALDHPELVRRVALGSCTAKTREPARAVFEKWIALAKEGDVRTLNRSMREMLFSPAYLQTYQALFENDDRNATEKELSNFTVFARACEKFDISRDVQKISCPMLAVGSKNDRVFGKNASEELAKLAGCELQLYEKYGHAVYDEAPDFQQRLKEFFLIFG